MNDGEFMAKWEKSIYPVKTVSYRKDEEPFKNYWLLATAFELSLITGKLTLYFNHNKMRTLNVFQVRELH